MRYRSLLLSSSLFAAVAVAIFACSYGNYDGTSAASDGGSGEAGGTVVVEKTVDPNKEEKVQTPDTAFELTIAAGTFDGPARIEITRLANRLIDERLNVPVYSVTADKEPGLPFEVKFSGDSGNNDPGRALLPAIAQADGTTFRPTQLVGVTQQQSGPTGSFWGLTRRFGTFSLVYESFSQQGNTFTDVTPGSCLAQCCNGMNGNGNVGAIGTSCACNGPPNLQCFLGACKPNVAAAIERCVEIATSNRAPVSCAPSGGCQGGGTCNFPNMPCSGGSACCINGRSGMCTGTGANTCTGIAIRCDRGTPCADGTKCCVFDNEAYCASTCPNERTWCNAQSDCDGGVSADAGPDAGPNAEGPCRAAPNCPHGTCGEPPAPCK